MCQLPFMRRCVRNTTSPENTKSRCFPLAETASIVDAVVAAIADRPVRSPDPRDRPPLVEGARDADLEGRRVVVSAGAALMNLDLVMSAGATGWTMLSGAGTGMLREAVPAVNTYMAAVGLLLSALAMWWWADRTMLM